MGVKSTIELTRKEAEEKYVSLVKDDITRKILACAVSMDERQLENELERLNDKLHDGEGFENYLILLP